MLRMSRVTFPRLMNRGNVALRRGQPNAMTAITKGENRKTVTII